MAGKRRFVIQRNDGAWYAGRDQNYAELWSAARGQRHEFESEFEAWQLVSQLQRAGVRAKVLAVEQDAQGETE